MDGLKKNTLVLKLVTLGEHVKGVVNVLVNFLSIAHLLEQTTKDTDTTHPEYLYGETGVSSTATLSGSYIAIGG